MTKKENTPDVKIEDGNAQPEIVKIDGNVAIEASGDLTINTPTERNVDGAGAKAMMDAPLPADVQAVVEQNAGKPKTKKVKTGKHVITGEDVMKDVDVPYEKDYSEGRTLYTAHSVISGSYNGRRINLSKGSEVYLNADEYEIFKPYVNE